MPLFRALLCVVVLGLTLSVAVEAHPQQSPPQTPPTDARVLITIAPKSGAPLAAVKNDDVSVRDDKHPVQVVEVRPVKDEPLIFSLMLDVSGSMRKIGKEQDAAAVRIFKSLAVPGNQGHLLLFNDNPDYAEIGDDVIDFAAAERELRFHDWRGSTSLYDATIEAAQQVMSSKNAPSERRVIVVISDGNDETSHSSFGGALGALQRFGIPLIGVYIHDPNFAKGQPVSDKEVLKKFRQLCDYSGGMVVNDPENAVPEIQNYLASQYLLTFAPSPESPKDLHMLEVKCKHDCTVSAPAWYFAP